jgi:hypothetical protein
MACRSLAIYSNRHKTDAPSAAVDGARNLAYSGRRKEVLVRIHDPVQRHVEDLSRAMRVV